MSRSNTKEPKEQNELSGKEYLRELKKLHVELVMLQGLWETKPHADDSCAGPLLQGDSIIAAEFEEEAQP